MSNMEFTVEGLGSIETVEKLLALTGQNEKGEFFKLYVGSNPEDPHSVMGGIVRLETPAGIGFTVGRLNMTCKSWAQPILVMSCFNSDPALVGRLLQIAADDKLFHELEWKRKEQLYEERRAARKADPHAKSNELIGKFVANGGLD